MILNAIKTLAVLSTLILLSSCIKIQIKPKDVVTDSVTAGKSLYQTIKRKKDGTEERLYTHTVALESDTDLQETAKQCLGYLKSTASADSEKEMVILEQSTEVVKTDTGNKLKCMLRAVL